MSSNAKSADSRLWLDGDGFRAPTGTELPADISTIFNETITGYDPFGGIKAGFTVSGERETTDFTIWNADGVYRTKKGPKVETIRFRIVDVANKAATLTVLQGGSVVEVGVDSGVFKHVQGNDETFSVILVGRDPEYGNVAYHFKSVTLVNVPDQNVNDEDLDGYDVELKVLSDPAGGTPYDKYTDYNPLATTP